MTVGRKKKFAYANEYKRSLEDPVTLTCVCSVLTSFKVFPVYKCKLPERTFLKG